MSDEAQIATLQREVRRAGQQTFDLRVKWVNWGVGILAVVSLATLLLAYVPGLELVAFVGCMAVPAGVLIGLFGLAGGTAWRRSKREALARQLSRISASDRAAVLLPLRKELLVDTRAIAEALIRELGVSTELSPAAAPDGRGDEPAGA